MTNTANQHRSGIVVIIILAMLVAGAGGYLLGRHSAHETATTEESPTEGSEPEVEKIATVRTVSARRGGLPRTIVAYGPVVARPGESHILSASYETRVRRVFVSVGQHVAAGAPLVSVEPSPEARLQFAEAQHAVTKAEEELKQVQQRFDAKLATNQELATAKQTLDSGRRKMENLRQRGAGGDEQTFKAEADGIVSVVAAQEGQIVQAGAPLVELAPADQIEIRLGVPPADVASLAAGQEFRVASVARPTTQPIVGHIRLVSAKVSPDTRLVDVFVTPATGSGLVLDEFARGEAQFSGGLEGILVPRAAVLPADEGQVLFTVVDGHAVKHIVSLIAQSGEAAEVDGGDVHEGDLVVVLGNYEVEDGMKVVTSGATTEPSR